MVVRTLQPTKTSLELFLSAGLKVNAAPPLKSTSNKNYEDVVVPYRIRLFDPPEFRMRGGWPTEVPPLDIHSNGLVSGSGYTMEFRPNPMDITTGATTRWIASDDTFSIDNTSWTSSQTIDTETSWMSAPDFMPTLIDDYTYSIKHERFSVKAVDFTHVLSKHMWATIPFLDGISGFTIIMVCSLNSTYSNDAAGGFQGIIGSGFPTIVEGEVEHKPPDPFQLKLKSGGLFLVSGGVQPSTVAIANLMSRTAPMYLAIKVNRPNAVIHFGTGPRSMSAVQVKSGDRAPFSGDLVLGRTLGDTLHCADMCIMDLGIYGDTMDADQIRTQVAKLSSVYGAS